MVSWALRKWIRSFRGLEETSWFATADLCSFLAMAPRSLRLLFNRNTSRARTPALTKEASSLADSRRPRSGVEPVSTRDAMEPASRG
jgi:hypothetical protein